MLTSSFLNLYSSYTNFTLFTFFLILEREKRNSHTWYTFRLLFANQTQISPRIWPQVIAKNRGCRRGLILRLSPRRIRAFLMLQIHQRSTPPFLKIGTIWTRIIIFMILSAICRRPRQPRRHLWHFENWITGKWSTPVQFEFPRLVFGGRVLRPFWRLVHGLRGQSPSPRQSRKMHPTQGRRLRKLTQRSQVGPGVNTKLCFGHARLLRPVGRQTHFGPWAGQALCTVLAPTSNGLTWACV